MPRKNLICIPAHNEQETIGAVLDNILSLPIKNLFDVLVVNDGSSDNTEQICRDKGVMVITHIFNSGYGSALKTAYKYASERGYEYIIQLDADGQHDVNDIERLYEQLTVVGENPPDIVIGSRFLDKTVSYYTPPHKKFVIAAINAMIRVTTKHRITDPTSGLQGLARRAFCFYAGFNRFDTDYPDANMVIQMILNGFDVQEIPVVMFQRLEGVSMHDGLYKQMKYVVKMILSIWIVFFRESFNSGKAKKADKLLKIKQEKEQRVPEHAGTRTKRD